jgi:hypothetical protein
MQVMTLRILLQEGTSLGSAKVIFKKSAFVCEGW